VENFTPRPIYLLENRPTYHWTEEWVGSIAKLEIFGDRKILMSQPGTVLSFCLSSPPYQVHYPSSLVETEP